MFLIKYLFCGVCVFICFIIFRMSKERYTLILKVTSILVSSDKPPTDPHIHWTRVVGMRPLSPSTFFIEWGPP